MNYLNYMTRRMYISQTYNGSSKNSSHYKYSHGVPASYPIDECGENGISPFYCPCDNMKVVKKLYYKNNKKASIVVFESTEKVDTPSFNDYVTIIVGHIEDSVIAKMKKKFVRNEFMFYEGNDNTTANHAHIEVAKGKYKGFKTNSLKGYCLKNAVQPEDAFYIDTDFTTIKKSGGIDWKMQPEEQYYIVKSGDNLSKIAKKFNTTWQKIYENNKKTIGSNPNKIKIGQRLVIVK